jgi:hypothetical protein
MRRDGFPFPSSEWERRARANALAKEHPERLGQVLVTVVQVLAASPVRSQTKLRRAVRKVLGQCSDGDVDAAVQLLGAAVKRSTGSRGATVYRLDFDALPHELKARLPNTTHER